MKLLVGYATTEGQARKIARHVADRLSDLGHMVELLPLTEAEGLDLARFERAILVASVHVGHYQTALAAFVVAQREALAAMPTLFLSVSLAAAGHDAADWLGLDEVLADFTEATGWTPGHVEQVAGAYAPERYDILRRFVMRRVVARKDPGADLDHGREYTDWPALDGAVDGWLEA